MESTSKTIRAHLTLVEVIIGIVLLGVAGFFLVRGMSIAREREQRRQIVEALEKWHSKGWQSEEQANVAKDIWRLVKANPKLHDAQSSLYFTPLHVAAVHDNRDIAQCLLDSGATIDARDTGNATPLHQAAVSGSKEVAKLLLMRGADVNAMEKYGDTPLDWARKWINQELTDILRKHGARE